MTDELRDDCDVLVIGGGAAGLSGALMLARSRRSVVVIDAGAPRNAPADGVHGLLALEGTPPRELLERGRAEVRGYGGRVLTGSVVAVARADGGFTATLADGRTVRARRLLVTTGLVDELPDVPGVPERWGRDVLHCPYCHGWEVRDRAIGVLAGGPMSVHQALLFRQLSPDVTFFLHTTRPDDEQSEQLAARGIRVVDGEVAGLEVAEDRLAGVRLADGTVVGCEALAVSPRMVARAGFLAGIGLRTAEHPAGVGEHVPADATGRTAVPGVWVAGNVTEPSAQVGGAAAAGALAGAHINADLVAEETQRAVAAHRPPEDFGRDFWEERYRSGHIGEHHGEVNPHLGAEIGDLEPGRALDAGCGEGAEAIWLASRGWRVTAVDIATTALDHARDQAAATGVADRVDWIQADLTDWTPAEAAFDVVTAFYVHPAGSRAALFRRLAAAVAPGGTLLVVGHHPSDPHGGEHAPAPGSHVTAEEIADALDPDRWDVVVAEARDRTASVHGRELALHDTVLRARKRS